jgi:hypothetical protein
MKDIIPPENNDSQKPDSGNSESQILNCRISEIPTYPEVTEKIKEEFELGAAAPVTPMEYGEYSESQFTSISSHCHLSTRYSSTKGIPTGLTQG